MEQDYTTSERKLEIAVFDVEGAIAAKAGGADRIELCAAIHEGGISPSPGTIETVRRLVDIPIHVMIRPRGGNFLYSDTEFQVMQTDIIACKVLGIDGIVLGLLTGSNEVDKDRCRFLCQLAYPMSLTFHRAFDFTPDPFQAMENIIELGFSRILTSGQQVSAIKGMPLIKELVEKASNRIIIMPGAGILPENICELAKTTGATDLHASAKSPADNHVDNLLLGGTKLWKTDKDTVAQLHARLQDNCR